MIIVFFPSLANFDSGSQNLKSPISIRPKYLFRPKYIFFNHSGFCIRSAWNFDWPWNIWQGSGGASEQEVITKGTSVEEVTEEQREANEQPGDATTSEESLPTDHLPDKASETAAKTHHEFVVSNDGTSMTADFTSDGASLLTSQAITDKDGSSLFTQSGGSGTGKKAAVAHAHVDKSAWIVNNVDAKEVGSEKEKLYVGHGFEGDHEAQVVEHTSALEAGAMSGATAVSKIIDLVGDHSHAAKAFSKLMIRLEVEVKETDGSHKAVEIIKHKLQALDREHDHG